MSETGRKMDVEDVLSSIRRLVSEEARTAHDDHIPAKTTDSSDESLLQTRNAPPKEKLVLTPSLRVSDAIAPPPIQAEIEQRIADIESLVMSEAVATAKADIAASVEVQEPLSPLPDDAPMEMDAVPDDKEPHKEFQNTDPEFSRSNGEMMSALHLSMRDFARAEPPLTANITSAPVKSDVTIDPPELEKTETDIDSDDLANTAKATTKIMHAEQINRDHVDESTETIISDLLVESAPSVKPAEPETPAQDAEMAQTDSFDAEVADFYDIPAEGEQSTTEEVATTAYVASESPFVGESDFQAPRPEFTQPADIANEEPDLSHETTIQREAPVTTLQDGEGATDTGAAAEDLFEEPVDYTEGDDSFLDEESLREMVSEMVRSELQGELGDRITRNVRKLVRREIYRALASREFE